MWLCQVKMWDMYEHLTLLIHIASLLHSVISVRKCVKYSIWPLIPPQLYSIWIQSKATGLFELMVHVPDGTPTNCHSTSIRRHTSALFLLLKIHMQGKREEKRIGWTHIKEVRDRVVREWMNEGQRESYTPRRRNRSPAYRESTLVGALRVQLMDMAGRRKMINDSAHMCMYVTVKNVYTLVHKLHKALHVCICVWGWWILIGACGHWFLVQTRWQEWSLCRHAIVGGLSIPLFLTDVAFFFFPISLSSEIIMHLNEQ